MLVFPTRALPLWRYTRTTQRAANPTECQVFRAIRKTILTANLMTGNVATALVSRCFDTAIMLGAYIFDCAKHGAVFDRQQIKSMSLAGKNGFRLGTIVEEFCQIRGKPTSLVSSA
jgi:hypothetical protein